MIELVIKNYLDGHLDVPSFFEHQNGLKGKYVLVEKLSGGKKNMLNSSVFAFQSYADSLFESAQLNEQVKEAVDAMVELPEITGIQLNSDYNFTDTQTKKYRYQAVFDINYY